MDKFPLSSDKDIADFLKRGKALRQDKLEWGILIGQIIIISALLLTIALSAIIIGYDSYKNGNLAFFRELYESSGKLILGGLIVREFDFLRKKK